MNLKHKTNVWVNHRLITKEQQKEILKQEDRRFLPFVLLSFLWSGILCFLIGVVSFLRAHWLEIPSSIKSGSFLIIAIGVGITIFYAMKNHKKFLLEIALFIAFLMIGGGIGLCAQLFNLPLESHQGLLLWSVLSFLLAYISKKEFLFLLWIPLFLGGLLGFLKLELLLLFFEQSPVFTTSLLSGVLLLVIYVSKNFQNKYISSCYKWAVALYIGILFLGDNSIKSVMEGFVLFSFFMLLLLSLSIKERRIYLFNVVSFFLLLRLVYLYTELSHNPHITGVGFLSLGIGILALSFVWYLIENKIK
ncbi:MAG: DUF2157 domain-containing protein [Alphaproteobacteria bacterium]|nr:DUF2157 domain-containing protein [Alphaproteobacteria bacterium]